MKLFAQLADAEDELRAIDMNELADAVREASERIALVEGCVPAPIPDEPSGVRLTEGVQLSLPCTGTLVHSEFEHCPRHDHA